MAPSLIVGRTYRVLANRSNNLVTGERVVYVGTQPGPDAIGGDRVTTDLDWKPGDPIPAIGNLYESPRPTPWATLVNPDWLQGPIEPLAAGQVARITSQNSQTNLSVGTTVVLVRPHRSNERLWVVSTDLSVTEESTRGVRVRSTGLLRYAMDDILSTEGVRQPTARAATETPAPAPGVKVRIDDDHNHEFPVGTVATLVRPYSEGADFFLITTADWRVGDAEPDWTDSATAPNAARYVDRNQFTVLPVDIATTTEEPTVTANPDFPAQVPGAKFIVTGRTSSIEAIEQGSTVTFVRDHAWRADLCVVSTRDWAPGQTAPTGQGGDDVRSEDGFYYASRAALTLLPETPAAAPTYLDREVRQGDLAEVIAISGGTAHPAPVGARVRVVRRNLMMARKWLVSTNLDDTEHSTRGSGPNGDNDLHWTATEDMRPLAAEPVAATPLAPAPGVKARIVRSEDAGYAGHHLPAGTEVTIVRRSNSYETCDWRVVVGDWSPGQPEPAQTGIDSAREARPGASRLVYASDIEVIQPVTGHDETVSEADALRAERDAAVKALEDFKQKVREVATKEAADRGWCTEIDEVLEHIEPGLTRVKRYTKVTRMIEVTYTVEQDGRDDAVLLQPSAFIGLGAIRPGHRDRVATLTASWASGQPTRTTVTEADIAGTSSPSAPTVGTPLTRDTVLERGQRLRVLASPRWSNRASDKFHEGQIVTATNTRVDADGDFAVEFTDGDYIHGYLLPESLTLAD